jgi:formate hydrogenlyase subunit 4
VRWGTTKIMMEGSRWWKLGSRRCFAAGAIGLTGVGRSRRYEARISTRFGPTASQDLRDLVLLTFKRCRTISIEGGRVVVFFLWAWLAVGDSSGTSPAWLRSWTTSSWPPLASPCDKLARASVNTCARELLGFGGSDSLRTEIWTKEGAIYRGFDTHA